MGGGCTRETWRHPCVSTRNEHPTRAPQGRRGQSRGDRSSPRTRRRRWRWWPARGESSCCGCTATGSTAPGCVPLAEIVRGNPLAEGLHALGRPRPGTVGDGLRHQPARVHGPRQDCDSIRATPAQTSAPTAMKTVLAGASSTASRAGRAGRFATPRGCRLPPCPLGGSNTC